MVLDYKGRNGIDSWTCVNYLCTEQVRSPYTQHAASGLPNPTHLEGEVRFDQAQDQQVVTTRSPRIVTGCLLPRSMLIKMYVSAIYSWFRIGTILSLRKHEYEFITTLIIEFDESVQSYLTSSALSILNTLVLLMSFRVHLL